jgi:heme/copper-type cytochrome/quinol oxidase subunit 2
MENNVYAWQKSRRLQAIVVAVALSVFALLRPVGAAEDTDAKKFTLVNVIFDGTKIWLPSSLIVYRGETVELTLINKLDEPHGFMMEAFGIEAVVQPKSKTTVQFTPDKAGLHTYICQLHPPHIGGQILVLDK